MEANTVCESCVCVYVCICVCVSVVCRGLGVLPDIKLTLPSVGTSSGDIECMGS